MVEDLPGDPFPYSYRKSSFPADDEVEELSSLSFVRLFETGGALSSFSRSELPSILSEEMETY